MELNSPLAQANLVPSKSLGRGHTADQLTLTSTQDPPGRCAVSDSANNHCLTVIAEAGTATLLA
eukprot:scaffold125058_cov51-Phaeocystis_antarctica.AAC.2